MNEAFIIAALSTYSFLADIMAYLYLSIAIIAEVIATSALKASKEFSVLTPSLVVIVGYAAAFYFMTLALRTIPLGITYAIWSGVGIVLVTLAGVMLYKETPDVPALIGIAFIIIGVVIIQVFSKTTGH